MAATATSPFRSVAAEAAGVVCLIYEAAVDTSRWRVFLDVYVEVVGGRRAALLLSSGHPNGTARFIWSNRSERNQQLNINWEAEGEWYRNISKSQPEGAIRTIDRLDGEAMGQYTEPVSYTSGDVRYGLIGTFLRTGFGPFRIVAIRAEGDGPFGESAVSILRGLMPHLHQVALLQSEVNSLRMRVAAFAAYLDRSPFPFLLTNAEGRILYANAASGQTTRLKDGLAISSGCLAATFPGSHAALRGAIEDVAAGRSETLRRIKVERASRKPPYRLILMPVTSPAAIPLGLFQPATAILIVDTEAEPELDPEILGELFSLTPAEARVAGKLGEGRSAEEIAEGMGLSLETVRTHIRRVLSKTATGRQGELIALILRTAPFRHLRNEASNPVPFSDSASRSSW
jgi:DNA-binding CsgD family transcriptional regulator/PAS domain-containing protein